MNIVNIFLEFQFHICYDRFTHEYELRDKHDCGKRKDRKQGEGSEAC